MCKACKFLPKINFFTCPVRGFRIQSRVRRSSLRQIHGKPHHNRLHEIWRQIRTRLPSGKLLTSQEAYWTQIRAQNGEFLWKDGLWLCSKRWLTIKRWQSMNSAAWSTTECRPCRMFKSILPPSTTKPTLICKDRLINLMKQRRLKSEKSKRKLSSELIQFSRNWLRKLRKSSLINLRGQKWEMWEKVVAQAHNLESLRRAGLVSQITTRPSWGTARLRNRRLQRSLRETIKESTMMQSQMPSLYNFKTS